MKLISKILFNSGKMRWMYRKIGKPNSSQWADYLRLHGGFKHIGQGTKINPGAVITDPYLVSIGNNCTLSNCHLICHDGSVEQVFTATGKRVDAVGKILIHDNCFIGHGVTVLRNVEIGPNAIVGAGSMVCRNIPPNCVAVGSPAKQICTMEEYAEKLRLETEELSWADLIGNDNPDIYEIRKIRQQYYYPS